MNSAHNMWKDDKGFIWMLTIAMLILVISQVPEGILFQTKFISRAGFFLFTLFAIRSSTLSHFRKRLGYGLAFSLMLMAVAMIQTDNIGLLIVYTLLITSYTLFIIGLVINQIFDGERITINKIGGGVAAYILLGHVWASLYITLFIVDPESFLLGGEPIASGEATRQLSYFSFVTLTTIGYGDITAVSSAARILAISEGLLGQLFPAILIAKLVSMQINDARKG